MDFLVPHWPAPRFVRAGTTQRFNPSDDINVCVKNASDVQQTLNNRHSIQHQFNFSAEPAWLNQVHGNTCVNIDESSNREADASYTQAINRPLAILTADCLPIIITHLHQPEIAAIHAGWKGLFNGVIEQTLKKCKDETGNYLAWFGPAICQNCYAVSETFRDDFLQKYPGSEACFTYHQQWHFSLTSMAEHILNTHGIQKVYHSHECTFENPSFYSYRRSQGTDGRIATFIWLEEQQ